MVACSAPESEHFHRHWKSCNVPLYAAVFVKVQVAQADVADHVDVVPHDNVLRKRSWPGCSLFAMRPIYCMFFGCVRRGRFRLVPPVFCC